jgi:predicted PurR-regulated permease PerM
MKFNLNIKLVIAVVVTAAFIGSFCSTQTQLSDLRNLGRSYYGMVQSKITSLETKIARLEKQAKADSNEQTAKELLKKFIDELKENFK